MKHTIVLLLAFLAQLASSDLYLKKAALSPSFRDINHLARQRHNNNRHLQSSVSDYDFFCDKFQTVYGTCACTSNPDAALGVISTTAFISCTPPNIVVNANFTSTDRYLSELVYCNELKDTCISIDFSANGEATGCAVDYVVSGEAPTACSSCTPCALTTTDGFDIDCSNIFAEATTDECAAAETLLEFDPFQERGSGAATLGGGGWRLTTALIFGAIFIVFS